MHAIVIYDSNYGNTKIIAETIASKLGIPAESITQISQEKLHNLDLLVVGSPINGWRPTEKMRSFLQELDDHQLDGAQVAAFDTRVKLFIHGDAAGKIVDMLESAGGKSVVPPQGFIVKGEKGPLLEGEKEKAKKWAEQIKDAL